MWETLAQHLQCLTCGPRLGDSLHGITMVWCKTTKRDGQFRRLNCYVYAVIHTHELSENDNDFLITLILG